MSLFCHFRRRISEILFDQKVQHFRRSAESLSMTNLHYFTPHRQAHILILINFHRVGPTHLLNCNFQGPDYLESSDLHHRRSRSDSPSSQQPSAVHVIWHLHVLSKQVTEELDEPANKNAYFNAVNLVSSRILQDTIAEVIDHVKKKRNGNVLQKVCDAF